MPKTFARSSEVDQKFIELLTLLNQMSPPGKGNFADKWAELIKRIEEAHVEFVALGGPQSGSSG